jgi:5-methylcytosine-specific restriction protein B
MKQADQIHRYVLKTYIEPARQRGESSVRVRASEVHAGLGLKSRFPAVCSALDGNKFLEQAKVTLVQRSGPLQSSTVEWVFNIK